MSVVLSIPVADGMGSGMAGVLQGKVFKLETSGKLGGGVGGSGPKKPPVTKGSWPRPQCGSCPEMNSRFSR